LIFDRLTAAIFVSKSVPKTAGWEEVEVLRALKQGGVREYLPVEKAFVA
jgi:hypothetical protein